jgi:hypothetical protein
MLEHRTDPLLPTHRFFWRVLGFLGLSGIVSTAGGVDVQGARQFTLVQGAGDVTVFGSGFTGGTIASTSGNVTAFGAAVLSTVSAGFAATVSGAEIGAVTAGTDARVNGTEIGFVGAGQDATVSATTIFGVDEG